MIFRLVLKVLKKPQQSLRFLRFFLLRPNTYVLATMHQSGTHWLQNILANIFSEQEFKSPSLIIPKLDQPCLYEKDYKKPKVVHTHTSWNPLFYFHPSIILVRDLRDSIVSQYEKYKKVTNKKVTFSDFLRKGNEHIPAGHAPIETRVHFLNSWAGRNSYILRYEDLKNSQTEEVKNVLSFIGVYANFDILDRAIKKSSLDSMKKENSFAVNKGVVGRYQEYFSEEDKKYFLDYIKTNLKDSYGYDYAKW